ncbi:protein MODIFIED TRANSPORT TO THE VACUOLE 1 [Dendrobium catenatum]|uniref:VHS domain-containing protein n=1 Tax=Dendrobium catenatum TaxID=906689 RepID=A0A2I0X2K5_9ASPA|nr:protein MODIFIED TRANSPORT TO THE VACUOLE 1 [Dendrobium catenatum]PKU82127.1 VHS domain-containing protein [Dendrobium catenatum]
MDTSRRAVESYWRSRMIDGVTVDEDKIAPVYKLEEICELLRTSHASIVKEVSEFILKRLEHKSPIVKQKALRLVKYAVVKSGAEFRREMQRNSAAVRQLLHYKGNLDPLKGDALNKAVRDTAQEAISALFSSDDNKAAAAPAESINKRIEGFGNTNYEVPTEEKKSFLSEVVGLGSASIIQGITSLAVSHALKKNDSGTYRSPNLRRSLTTEIDSRDTYEPVDEHHGEKRQPSVSLRSAASGSWNPDSRNNLMSTSVNDENSSSHMVVKSREERLLETIVSSGGVRLQPTRDALQAFLAEASKLDPLAMSRAIEMKLQSHLWQVRMKAICVLESILRKQDDDYCSIIESYFSENNDAVVKCCELPQASLREKANKVLTLLGGDLHSAPGNEDPTDGKSKPVPTAQLPDLIDTGGLEDDEFGTSSKNLVDEGVGDLTSAPLVDDLFGGAQISEVSISKNENADDPFADVSFHTANEKKHTDIFSGLTIDDKKSDHIVLTENKHDFDIFGSNSWNVESDDKKNVQDLMAGNYLSVMNQDSVQTRASGALLDGSNQQSQLPPSVNSKGFLGPNDYYPMTGLQYNMQPNIMLNPALAAQSMNYGSMGAYITQQQLLYQNIGNANSGYINVAGLATDGGYASALPDIFQISNNPIQGNSPVMTNSKKDETKAFDFISEHISAARDSKRIR